MTDLGGAWTDAVLAATCAAVVFGSKRGHPSHGVLVVGAAWVGLAALLGTFRLGGAASLATWHDGLSDAAAVVGVPLIAWAVAVRGLDQRAALASRVVVFVHAFGLVLFTTPAARTAVGAVALVAAAAAGALNRRPDAIAGAVLVAIAGLIIPRDASFLALSGVGWFHLALAAGVALLARATRPEEG